MKVRRQKDDFSFAVSSGFLQIPTNKNHPPPTNFFQATSQSYLLLAVLFFTILVRFFCRFCYWVTGAAGWDPAIAHTRTHDTCAEESVAMTVTAAAAAAGARHFRQKKPACSVVRRALKP
jgi:hypothetical protein